MPLDIPRIRAICFDVDGTLRDTDDQIVDLLAQGLSILKWLFPQRNPRPFARRLIMAMENPGNTVLHMLDRLGIDDEIDAFANLLYRFKRKKITSNHTLIPGSLATLELFQRRYPMAIVSSRGERKTLEFLQHFELYRFFQCVVTSQTCSHSKPYPDPILWAATQMNVSAEECLMVGDTAVDIRAGLAAGCQTVGVLSGFGEKEELIRAGAHVVLPAVTDLQDILRE